MGIYKLNILITLISINIFSSLIEPSRLYDSTTHHQTADRQRVAWEQVHIKQLLFKLRALCQRKEATNNITPNWTETNICRAISFPKTFSELPTTKKKKSSYLFPVTSEKDSASNRYTEDAVNQADVHLQVAALFSSGKFIPTSALRTLVMLAVDWSCCAGWQANFSRPTCHHDESNNTSDISSWTQLSVAKRSWLDRSLISKLRLQSAAKRSWLDRAILGRLRNKSGDQLLSGSSLTEAASSFSHIDVSKKRSWIENSKRLVANAYWRKLFRSSDNNVKDLFNKILSWMKRCDTASSYPPEST